MVHVFWSDVFRTFGLAFTKPAMGSPAPPGRAVRPFGDRAALAPERLPPEVADSARSDEQLMLAHAAGDGAAFGLLYQRYVHPLLRLMARAHRSSDEARDLVQQTFLQLHRARADYDSTRRFRPWIYTIALNLSREALRKQRRRPTLWSGASGAPEASADWPLPEQLQITRTVRLEIEALPRYQREVIELHWLDGLTFTEIAQCLGVATSTAKVRAHRGYETLRARLRHLAG